VRSRLNGFSVVLLLEIPKNVAFIFAFTLWEIRNSQTFQQQRCSYHDVDVDITSLGTCVSLCGVWELKWNVWEPSSHKLPLNLTPVCKNSSYVCVCVCLRAWNTIQHRTVPYYSTDNHPLCSRRSPLPWCCLLKDGGRLCRWSKTSQMLRHDAT